MRRIAVDGNAPSADTLAGAAAVVARGGVVAFPTDTLYGLAVDPFSPAAVARLFDVKGRAAGQAIALVASDVAQVEEWLGPMPRASRRLAERFWPGPLTILVGTGARSSYGTDTRPPYVLALGIAAADGTVGVRVPDHAVARGLCRAAGRPLTATSANLSGQLPSADPDEVARLLADRIDLLLDAGPTTGGPASTIIDATGPAIRLVRAGAVDWETIQECARGE